MKYKVFSLLTLTMLLWAFPAVNFAGDADPEPVVMLKQATNEMLEALRTHKADIRHNRSTLYSIVKRIMIPHVDEDSMAQQVVGRHIGQAPSNADHQLFIDEFIKVVVSTYSAALTSYSDQQVKFLPLREGVSGKALEVKSQIVQSSGPGIELNYRLGLTRGQWKIRDFSVDGISLVQNYHSQFAEVLAQKGFKGLLQQLKDHNQQDAHAN